MYENCKECTRLCYYSPLMSVVWINLIVAMIFSIISMSHFLELCVCVFILYFYNHKNMCMHSWTVIVWVFIIPWSKPLQANVSLSLLRKFSISVLEMQQSPGNVEPIDIKVTGNVSANSCNNVLMEAHSYFTLCAAADVVLANPTELLLVLSGRVSATAAVIWETHKGYYNWMYSIYKRIH